MFLLRCLFWLGLAFSQIAQLEGTTAASLAGEATGAAGDQAAALGQMAAQAAQETCRVEPAKCLELAARAGGAIKSGSVAREGSAKASDTKRVDAKGRDTLTQADRAPAWREIRLAGK
ncbi:hypothetical protein [Rhodoblastus sp.]|jgi:hypothetical protein|uniref:hypothetical protein n=1 Tax=Rhodoblastus sp. TaxID=1962975 RepID=UPI0025FF22F8|nr:hypothetical protein [Rhodoblastus sp.]